MQHAARCRSFFECMQTVLLALAAHQSPADCQGEQVPWSIVPWTHPQGRVHRGGSACFHQQQMAAGGAALY